MRVVGRVRARTYFDLGLNIARLLSLVSGVAVVRAAAQLLAEFDYYCSKDGSIQDLVRVGTLGVCVKATSPVLALGGVACRSSWCPVPSQVTILIH
jgi:hypothetical protein